MTNPTPGAPVPPDKLREQWIEDAKSQTVVACYGSPIRVPSLNIVGYCIDRAAAWGYAQAMQERAELEAAILAIIDSEPELEGDPPAFIDNLSPMFIARSTVRCTKVCIRERVMALFQARAAAERLRGGGS
jgi:hypothetical protein